MAAGSQPASMPAESNLDQMIQLISPVRSAIFEIDPSFADRALSAGWEVTSPEHGAESDTALCANPHTPVSGSLAEQAAVPTVEQAAAAERAAKSAAKVARAAVNSAGTSPHDGDFGPTPGRPWTDHEQNQKPFC